MLRNYELRNLLRVDFDLKKKEWTNKYELRNSKFQD